MSPEDGPAIERLYLVDGLSPSAIADRYGTYANKVRRFLRDRGVRLRDLSEAMERSWEAGAVDRHAGARGVPRDPGVNARVREAVRRYWEEHPEARARTASMSAKLFENQGAAHRWKVRRRGKSSCLALKGRGLTRLQVFAFDALAAAGFAVALGRRPADLLVDPDGPRPVAVVLDGFWRLRKRPGEWRADRFPLLLAAGCRIVYARDPGRRFRVTFADALTKKIAETILNWPCETSFIEVDLGQDEGAGGGGGGDAGATPGGGA